MNELTGSKGCLATDTRSLREIAPLLENYFGITLGYFTNEIESSTGISAAKAIQEEHEIRLPTNRFDYDAYMEQFGETPLLTDRLREALLFMAYIITDRKFNEEDLRRRRAESVRNVKQTNGRISFEKRVRESWEDDDGWQD